MGQSHDRAMSNQTTFDANGENGLIMGDKYLPEELLIEIFIYTDYKTLLKCQLVCKRWKDLLQEYVWRKKAEMIIDRSLSSDKDLPWYVYYLICKKRPFERNLLKNHSGQYGVKKHWKIVAEGGNRWVVENPPVGVPPLSANVPIFEGKQCCFATSYINCCKVQKIDLEEEGLHPLLLDNLQPPVQVSEWYSCRWDCPAIYEFTAELLDKDDKVIDSFQHRDSIEGENQNQWLRVLYTFKNYGSGLRKINFYHGGVDKLFWEGNYGSKMAGACVCIKAPELQRSELDADNSNVD